MSPGLIGSEIAVTPPVLHRSMEDTFFPQISRKSTLSVNSDGEFRSERSTGSRISVPNSLSNSPVKFPTIDRSKSTSVTSLSSVTPATLSKARHRSRTRERDRSSFCRSPSCPSNLEYTKDHIDFSFLKRDSPVSAEQNATGSPAYTSEKDEIMKLPNIFRKESMSPTSNNKHRDIGTWQSDRTRGNTELGLRRSDSFRHSFHSSPEGQTPRARGNLENNNQRSQTQTLLLPIRSDTRLKLTQKKKKKGLGSRGHSQVMVENGLENSSPRMYDLCNKNNEEALEAIARENAQEDGDKNVSIEIQPTRNVKRWIKDNRRAAQKNGEVKA